MIMDLDMKFVEDCKKHLTTYLQNLSMVKEKKDRSNGIYRKAKDGKPEVRCGHIIDILDGENRVDLIKKYNIIGEEKCGETFKKLVVKPHTYAHHMNSSQIMCYNFFRPMMDDIVEDEIGWYGRPNGNLVSMIKESMHVDISSKTAECRFEYHDDLDGKYEFKKAPGVEKGGKESSSFDFFIKDGDVRRCIAIQWYRRSHISREYSG